MFHYSLIPSGSHARMLVAIVLAITAHMGLMSFSFSPKLLHVPDVSLPRSVSIYLGQKKVVEEPLQQLPENLSPGQSIEDKPIQEIEQMEPVSQKTYQAEDKAVIPPQQSAFVEELPEKPAATAQIPINPAVEKTVPVRQNLPETANKIRAATENIAKVQQSDTQVQAGVRMPGTLQTAYPRYQLNDPPAYPRLSRKRGQEGTVFLQVLVDEEGRVQDLEIENSSGFRLLDRAAESAVQKWVFEPGRRGEEKIPMWVRVPVTFQLHR